MHLTGRLGYSMLSQWIVNYIFGFTSLLFASLPRCETCFVSILLPKVFRECSFCRKSNDDFVNIYSSYYLTHGDISQHWLYLAPSFLYLVSRIAED